MQTMAKTQPDERRLLIALSSSVQFLDFPRSVLANDGSCWISVCGGRCDRYLPEVSPRVRPLPLPLHFSASCRFGNELVESCRVYAAADSKLSEKALRVESCWHRASIQLDFIRSIHGELDESLLSLHARIYDVLLAKLKDASRKLNSLRKASSEPGGAAQAPGDWRRFKFIRTRKFLEETIEDLDMWQKLFDPSWFLILRVSSASVDHRLEAHDQESSIIKKTKAVKDSLKEKPAQAVRVFLPEARLDSCDECSIAHSSTKHFKETPSRHHIVDTVQCDAGCSRDIVTRDIRALVTKLYFIDPNDSGVLQCRGAVRRKYEDGSLTFRLVFKWPTGIDGEVRSLRSLLCLEANHSLSERLKLAQQLSRSVCYVHSLGFVHKNVRPETILHFSNGDQSIGPAFLAGFDKFRNADGRTWRKGVCSWERNLYQHPGRQGIYPEEDYQMQHDIYSLGVCLLEVGTWTSLVTFDAADEPVASAYLQKFMEDEGSKDAEQTKQLLTGFAETRLPQTMGDRYARVVIDCLTCLDSDNAEFADRTQFEDPDGILIGVKYIEKVRLA